MTVAFRNVSTRPTDPVEGWSTEAVQAAVERGDLAEWRLLVEAVDADPWGQTARQIEEVLGHSRPFGTAELLERALESARVRTEAEERAAVAAELRELVGRSGLLQAEFARRLGTSASRMSSYINGVVVPAATLMVRARNVRGNRR